MCLFVFNWVRASKTPRLGVRNFMDFSYCLWLVAFVQRCVWINNAILPFPFIWNLIERKAEPAKGGEREMDEHPRKDGRF